MGVVSIYVSPGCLNLVVSGTRETSAHLEHYVPLYVCEVYKTYPHASGIIRVGCARGVDEIVRRTFTCQVYQAYWSEFGKRAGMMRNEVMLDAACEDTAAQPNSMTVLLAFPRIGGRGTQGCIKSALKRGIEVWEVPAEGGWYRIHPGRAQ